MIIYPILNFVLALMLTSLVLVEKPSSCSECQQKTEQRIAENAEIERSPEIDAEVLRLYDLPPKYERQLLDLFWEEKRRVPIDYSGYIPPEYESWIPLHIYISKNFRKTKAQEILKAIPNNCSPETIQFFQSLIVLNIYLK